ncbi:Rieske (2Fe-2S) protein [Reinekea marinisedimentorum]|uniref:Nitrite reductase/ring-hydroxylating ferredoxin subunit n=1 Tax=Reinekea marinisedimentorum TaxID=230495 RepID=A0A4R3IBP1_9GAMM|nr:Rieske 2Fe-2S domain-containing protein [Reinekea marinisedimentorum]TCS43053.1 nitrite reductase/ring-hydroxylating ferredoxin subunit [Reinekea marinisedimentorum]
MTVLCHIHDLEEGKSRGFDSPAGPVFAVKRDGQIFVYKNECPHLHTNLEYQADQFLDAEGALIECSVHGALFEIETGACLAGPCQGESLIPVEFEIQQEKICIA